MKLAILDRVPKIPLIDLVGGYIGPFSEDVSKVIPVNDSLADFFLSPHDLYDLRSQPKYLEYLVGISKKLPVILSNRSDFPGRLPRGRFIYLQNTVEIGRSRINVVIIPYNIAVPPIFQPRNYSRVPKISFLGYVPRNSLGRLYRSLTFPPKPVSRNSALVRRIGIKNIEKSNFDSAILMRDSYGGAVKSIKVNISRHRETYLESILAADIVFSPRGDANNSQRLYEVLGLGRLPLIPDTEIVMPKNVESAGFSSIITKPSSSDVEKQISNFWNGLNQSQYLELQYQNWQSFQMRFRFPKYISQLLATPKEDFLNNYVYDFSL